jgi:hypothetical protein
MRPRVTEYAGFDVCPDGRIVLWSTNVRGMSKPGRCIGHSLARPLSAGTGALRAASRSLGGDRGS